MTALNHESSRQKVLTALIEALQNEMTTVEATQKNEEEYTNNTYEKKIKKAEYDIKQILQKYNE